ncbi:DUF2200 family protein [Corynebacterium striatum]
MTQPKEPRIFRMEWKEIHNAYIAKVERKSRTREEVVKRPGFSSYLS